MLSFHNSIYKNRDFSLLWSGQFVSWIGTEVSSIALPLIVLAITGSSAFAGLIAGVRGLTYVFVSLPAGVIVDRFDRKTIMIIGNIGSGLATGTIAVGILLHFLSIPMLFIIGILEATFFTFANLARFSAVMQIVGTNNMPTASAQINLASHTSEFIGPALGGFLYQTVGAFISFFLDSISYFFNAVSLYFLKTSLKIERKESARAIKHEIKDGIIWLWKQRAIRLFTIITSGRFFLDSGIYLLIIILAKQNHASAVIIGLLFGAGAIGGIIGSLFATRIYNHLSARVITILCTAICLLLFPLYLIAHTNIFLGILTFLITAIEPIYLVLVNSYTAMQTPNELRGRINSMVRMIQFGSYSAGFLVMGVFLEKIGVTGSVFIFSSVLFIMVLFTFLDTELKRI